MSRYGDIVVIDKRFVAGLALGSLMVADSVHGAQGAGGAAGSKGPQSRPMQQEMERAQHRDQKRVRDPEAGEHVRAQKEETKREMKSGESRGEQTAAEMQERRAERKEIQEAYRADGEPDGPKAKKKPWWKFWGDNQT